MKHEQICPYCGGACSNLVQGGKDYFICEGDSPFFDIDYCRHCMVGFTKPLMDESALKPYYPDSFEAYVPKKRFIGWLQKLKYRQDITLIRRELPREEGTLFEIGAGRGEFLAAVRDYGFSVSGLEPGEAGRDYARKAFGIELSTLFAKDVSFDKEYDVVAIRHVMEHIDQPGKLMEKIYHEGLRKGGLLFLKLPRIDSWEFRFFRGFWSGLDLPRHRIHFTKNGIIQLLEKYGFTKIEVKSEITPLDIVRSLTYYSKYGPTGNLKNLAGIFSSLPYFLKVLLCQFSGLILSPFNAGRMIVIARKSE